MSRHLDALKWRREAFVLARSQTAKSRLQALELQQSAGLVTAAEAGRMQISPAGALLAASMPAASCVTLPDGPHTTDVLASAVHSSASSCAWLGSDNCADRSEVSPRGSDVARDARPESSQKLSSSGSETWQICSHRAK